jgi:hypothetical protein
MEKKMKKYLALLSLLLFVANAQAQGFDQEHKDWTELLKKVVRTKPDGSSDVHYQGVLRDPVLLNRYLKNLGNLKQDEFDKFSKSEQMAFYINAYNAFTVKLVIDHYPVPSIKKIGGILSSPWKMKFFRLFGREMTLDEVEHTILRKKYKEPRIHFAVNCASIGCPALRAEAFVGSRLDEQLAQQTQLFLRDKSRNYIDDAKNKVFLSKIFNWFEEDFTANGSSVQSFVATFMTDDPKIQEKLRKNAYDISYTDYNWDLNSAKN